MKAKPDALPRISQPVMRGFAMMVRRMLRRDFHALRIAGSIPDFGAFPRDEPLIVFTNHAGWWDPMLCLFLSRAYMEERSHYAPIDARGLERYGILKKLGFFGVEQDSAKGGRDFLRTARSILETPGAVLWITPQGAFRDPRLRPPGFAPGLGHLVEKLGRGTAVPLAMEYPFWEEKTPEALCRFGEPIPLTDKSDAGTWTRRLENALAQCQDELASAAISREPEAFHQLSGGSVGLPGPYALWQRVRAWSRGKRYDPEHGSIMR
jgi:1-acyl-sn-glycerol-3-phosphate acyltransferase